MWSHKSEFLSRHLFLTQTFIGFILIVIRRKLFIFLLLRKKIPRPEPPSSHSHILFCLLLF